MHGQVLVTKEKQSRATLSHDIFGFWLQMKFRSELKEIRMAAGGEQHFPSFSATQHDCDG
jgi:hypothetical protein